MADRISAADVRRRIDAGEDLTLVCAYDDTEKCAKTGVEPSIPLAKFRQQLSDIPKDRELVFFCA